MRFLFLGDSITEGMADPLGRAMLSLRQSSLVQSRSGISVEGMVDDELLEAGLAYRPNAVVVMLGTNPDGIVPADVFRASCRALLRKIWSVTDLVGWIGPWAGDDVGSRVRVISDLVRVKWANGVKVAEGLERAGENRVHFTSEAYPELARRVAAWTVRVVAPKVLTTPGTWGKVVSVLGIGGAAAIPTVPWMIGR